VGRRVAHLELAAAEARERRVGREARFIHTLVLGCGCELIGKRTKVCLMLVESLGGIYYPSKHQIHTISKRATGVSAIDRTRYGCASSSPHSFMQHHSQCLSRAAVMADAAAICKRVAVLKQHACMIPRQPITQVA
jgi:hypothetical protein